MTTITTAPRSVNFFRATLLGAALMAAPTVFGVSQYKNGTAGALNSTGSWVSGVLPGSGDIAVFTNGAGNITASQTTVWAGR